MNAGNSAEHFSAQDAQDNPDWTTIPGKELDAAAKLRHARLYVEMSQVAFAALLGIPVSTLRNWEQRRTMPDALATALIDLIYDDPEGIRSRLEKRRAAA